MTFLGGVGVHGQGNLLIPVEFGAGGAEFIVPVAGAGQMTGNVGGMSGDAVGDNALADVGFVGQAQMLAGGDIS